MISVALELDAGRGAAPVDGAAAMSLATMRPRGPEPFTFEISMPASAARRRASGVVPNPPAERAGPKFFAGVRTSKYGSSLIGSLRAARIAGAAIGLCTAGEVARTAPAA